MKYLNIIKEDLPTINEVITAGLLSERYVMVYIIKKAFLQRKEKAKLEGKVFEKEKCYRELSEIYPRSVDCIKHYLLGGRFSNIKVTL